MTAVLLPPGSPVLAAINVLAVFTKAQLNETNDLVVIDQPTDNGMFAAAGIALVAGGQNVVYVENAAASNILVGSRVQQTS